MAPPHEALRGAPARPARRGWTWLVVAVVVFVVLLGTGGFLGLRYIQSGFYVTADNGLVAIYQGSPDGVFGIDMSKKATEQPVPPVRVDDLPADKRAQVMRTIEVTGGASAARQTVNSLRRSLCQYTVGDDGGSVRIFRGRGQEKTGCTVTPLTGTPQLKLGELPTSDQEKVKDGIQATDRAAAQTEFNGLVAHRNACQKNPKAQKDCPK